MKTALLALTISSVFLLAGVSATYSSPLWKPTGTSQPLPWRTGSSVRSTPSTLAFQSRHTTSRGQQNIRRWNALLHEKSLMGSSSLIALLTTTSSPRHGIASRSSCHQSNPNSDLVLRASSDSTTENEGETLPLLDRILSDLTTAFPLFVLSGAIVGSVKPSLLLWTNRGSLITYALAIVTCAMGLTLKPKDFADVLKEKLSAVPAGVLCQFMIMPLAALLVGRRVLLPIATEKAAAVAAGSSASMAGIAPSLFLGLCLVGCAPGGTASNLVSFIARADVALSVVLTSCSTILASVLTPLLVKLLVGSTIKISGITLCIATAKVVLLPILVGVMVNSKVPSVATAISRFTPFACVLLISLVCGGVVAHNASSTLGGTAASSVLPVVVLSVVLLHIVGFSVGYFVPKRVLKFKESTSRTISIETGMQNSALAVVLARSLGSSVHPIAALPGALSATAHSCLGSALASYWRIQNTTSAEDAQSET